MNVSLIIGCGGAGIAAMEELIRLLAFSPERLERVACLAVDAERRVLESFGNWLRGQEESWKITDKRGRGPCVRMVCVGRKEREGVEEAIRGASGEGLRRLREHWWFDGDGRPFRGTRLCGVRGPAWASPTDAYGATWQALPEIEQVVSDLLDELVRRDADNPDSLRNLRVYVVAGLEGTTGRGSWYLVSEKVREFLRRFGVRVMPTAVLFGANVYDAVTSHVGRNFQRDAQVNALTGISELSGWLENSRRGGGDRVVWRLPNMSHPDGGGQTDVLRSDESEDPCGGPLGRAYLVCGGNAAGCLEGPHAYHRMAGKALYAMIEAPGYGETHVNDPECYGSLAGATFEVDALHIQAFCETLARERVFEELAEMRRGDAEAVEEAIGALWAKCPPTAPRDAAEFRPDPRGTLWQRVAHAAMETDAWQRGFESARDALKRCTAERAEELLLPLGQPRWEEPLREAMEETLPKTGIQAAVEEAAKRMLAGDRRRAVSPARALEFLKRLRERIAAARAAAPERLAMDTADGGKAAPDEAVRGWLRECGKRTILDMLLQKRRYGQQDLDRLCLPENGEEGRTWRGIIPQGVLAAMYPIVRERIDAELAEVLAFVETKIAGCESVVDACRTVRRWLDEEEGRAAGGHAGDDGFALLFATPDRIDETLCSGNDFRWWYHRILKPIEGSRGKVEDLAARSAVVGKWFLECVARALDFGYGNQGKDALARELANAARGGVGLRPGFLEEHYAFPRVLENNLPHWNRAIAAAAGDQREWDELSMRFHLTLGTEPVRDEFGGGDFKLPPTDELLWTIAESLASGCQPWWKLNEPEIGGEGLEFMPFDLHLHQPKRGAGIRAMENLTATWRVLAIGLESGRGTPFAYVAQREQMARMPPEEEAKGVHPLDKVHSLEWWRDSEVLNALRLAEREDGAAIFGEEGNTPGVGYVSPLYVRNEKLSACRWKPWLSRAGEERGAGAGRCSRATGAGHPSSPSRALGFSRAGKCRLPGKWNPTSGEGVADRQDSAGREAGYCEVLNLRSEPTAAQLERQISELKEEAEELWRQVAGKDSAMRLLGRRAEGMGKQQNDESDASASACPASSGKVRPEAVRLDRVDFSAIAPKSLTAEEYSVIQVAMYEKENRQIVEELMAAAEEPVKETRSGESEVVRGARIRVALASPDIELEDSEEEGEWQGGYKVFAFTVRLPDGFSKPQVRFVATVYIQDVAATKLKFVVSCRGARNGRPEVERADIHSAFVSYASEDRARVIRFVQGMQKVRPDLDVFLDVAQLRSGEDWEKRLYAEIGGRDVLYLCWSRYAKRSEWVEREWRYAFQTKGIAGIEPVPMEPPERCPPPEELSRLHFNDWLQYLAQEPVGGGTL